MKRTASGTWVRPKLVAYIFGGTWQQSCGGYGWRPNIVRTVRKFYRERWNDKHTLRAWLSFDDSARAYPTKHAA